MVDDALQQLETLRADTVERARRALVLALRGCEQADASLRAAVDHAAEQVRELRSARLGFAQADSVFGLRLAERRLRSLEAAKLRAQERVARCARAKQDADRERGLRQQTLRAAELSRRVVSRGLEQRVADVSLRTERRQEDERDDQYRAQQSARRASAAARDFPST